MRSRTLTDLIHYEAKKKPAIADLIKRAPFMTDDEIEAAQVPLPWYRKALLEIRTAAQREMMRAQIEDYVIDGWTSDPEGVMYEWHGNDEFIDLDRGSILLAYGKLVWFPKTGGVWIETLFSQKVDDRLLAQSVCKGAVTKDGYRDAYKAKAMRDCPIDAPVLIDQRPDTPAGRLAGWGVRIRR